MNFLLMLGLYYIQLGKTLAGPNLTGCRKLFPSLFVFVLIYISLADRHYINRLALLNNVLFLTNYRGWFPNTTILPQ